MATSTKNSTSAFLATLPNQLTVMRLILAVVLFGLMSQQMYAPSFVIFLIAAGTDWLDGFLARRYGWVTMLGRIMDPFADKVIICGTYILLVAAAGTPLHQFGMQGWVVVLIVGRELLITGLRSFLEQQGADFSASMSGKLKMVAQCVTASLCLYYLGYPADWVQSETFGQIITGWVWATVILTVYSGIAYIVAAARLMRPS